MSEEYENEIFLLQYSGNLLLKVPEEEAIFYIMIGSAANDISTLLKGLIANSKTPTFENEIAQNANSSIQMLLLRTLSGRLVEANKTLRQNNKMIYECYIDDISTDAQEAMSQIKKYFWGKRSLLLDVRDYFAFHHASDKVKSVYQDMDDKENLCDYYHIHTGNTLYYSAEIIHYSMLRQITGLSTKESLDRWLDDVMKQSKYFMDFSQGFIHTFAKRYFSAELKDAARETKPIPIHRQEDVIMPYFIGKGGADDNGTNETYP